MLTLKKKNNNLIKKTNTCSGRKDHEKTNE